MATPEARLYKNEKKKKKDKNKGKEKDKKEDKKKYRVFCTYV